MAEVSLTAEVSLMKVSRQLILSYPFARRKAADSSWNTPTSGAACPTAKLPKKPSRTELTP